MKKILKKVLVGLLVILVLLQFYRPGKEVSNAAPEHDIVTAYQTPAAITDILHKACYDCHSNNTVYPWYFNIQPVALWMAHHVDEGRDELNFSDFGSYKTKRKLKKLKEIVTEVEEGEMPLDSYTWIHSEAKLTAAEKQLLLEWAKGLSQKISLTEGSAL